MGNLMKQTILQTQISHDVTYTQVDFLQLLLLLQLE